MGFLPLPRGNFKDYDFHIAKSFFLIKCKLAHVRYWQLDPHCVTALLNIFCLFMDMLIELKALK